MSRSKTGTPVSEHHPANKLTYIEEDIKLQLQKTPFQLIIEAENYQQQLNDLRNDWKYAVVLQWLYLFRGAIRLSGEPFSVDILEEELVGLTEPTLLNKITTNLVFVLLGAKVTVEDFSFKARYVLGDTTTVLGTEDDPVDFDLLSLVDKFDVLYQLVFQLQYTDNFRKQVEKYEKENELRMEPIFEDGEESYFLLSDNRIYSRKLNKFPKLAIPRKFKYAKKIDPEVEFADIEPNFEWECVANGIYQIHDFLVSIAKDKKMKPLFNNIKQHINIIAEDDLNRRKKVIKRKREQQLHEMVNNRKRSSRLQEREEQMRIEKEKQEAEEELRRQEQARIKAARKLKSKENLIKREFEERLRHSSSSRRTTVFDSGYTPGVPPKELELGDNGWLFECYCGVRELNYDDGGKLISCERCLRWQHLKCQDRVVQQELIRNSNEVFICNWCKQDLELEVEKKLEDEKIQREKEIEEKQRQRELSKQREIDEKARLEEEERIRKEELEKERERRTLERERMRETSINLTPGPIESPQPIQPVQSAQPAQPAQQQSVDHQYPQQLPSMGSFHVYNQQTPVFNNSFQSNGHPTNGGIQQPNLQPQPNQFSAPSQGQQTAFEQQSPAPIPQLQARPSIPIPQPVSPAKQSPIGQQQQQQQNGNGSPSKQNESPSRSFSIQNILG